MSYINRTLSIASSGECFLHKNDYFIDISCISKCKTILLNQLLFESNFTTSCSVVV